MRCRDRRRRGRVERVAFGQAELAAHHFVEGAHIADHVDALDVDPGPFVDYVGEIDGLIVRALFQIGLDVDESIAELADFIGERGDRRLDVVGVVDLVRLGFEKLA